MGTNEGDGEERRYGLGTEYHLRGTDAPVYSRLFSVDLLCPPVFCLIYFSHILGSF